MSEHDDGAPGAATAATMHPCLCCVFVILCSELNFPLSRVPGRARSAVYGPSQTNRRSEFICKIDLLLTLHSFFFFFFLMSHRFTLNSPNWRYFYPGALKM